MADTNDVRNGLVSSLPKGTPAAPIIKREEIETSLETWIDVDQLDSEATRCATCDINATHNISPSPTQMPKAENYGAFKSVSEPRTTAGNARELPSSVDEGLTMADLEALLATCSPNMFTSQLDMQSVAHAVIQYLIDQSENAVPSHIPPPMAPLNQMPTTSRPVKPCDTQRLHYIIGGKVVTPADFPDAEDMLREIFSIPFPAPLSFDSIADAAHLFRNQEHCDRPPYKNAELAALAIYTHERRMATLHEIREIVTRRYPSLKETSFKDSLRHLLSYDASFVKIPQTESNGGPRGGGDYWALNIEMWGKKKRVKMRKRAPPKPKPEPCSRPVKRSAKSRKTDDLLKVEETSIHSPNIDEFVGESESPRKRRRMSRIKVEDLDTAGFDSSPVWLHNPWEAEPTTPTEVQMSDLVRLPLPPEPPTVWSLPSPPMETFSKDVELSSLALANVNLSGEPMLVDQESFAPSLSIKIASKSSGSSFKLPLTPPDTPEALTDTASTSKQTVLSLSHSSVTRTAMEKPSRALESLLVLPPSSGSIFEARSHQDHLAIGRDPDGKLNGLLGPSLFPAFSPLHAPGPNNETTKEGHRGSPVSKASDETRVISLKRAHDTELRIVSAPKATRLSPTPESSKPLTRVTRSMVQVRKPSIVEKKEPSTKKAAAKRSDTRPSLEADQVAVAVRQSLREKKRIRRW